MHELRYVFTTQQLDQSKVHSLKTRAGAKPSLLSERFNEVAVSPWRWRIMLPLTAWERLQGGERMSQDVYMCDVRSAGDTESSAVFCLFWESETSLIISPLQSPENELMLWEQSALKRWSHLLKQKSSYKTHAGHTLKHVRNPSVCMFFKTLAHLHSCTCTSDKLHLNSMHSFWIKSHCSLM